MTSNQITRGFCGTLNYMAPEIIDGDDYKAGPVDIWALGVLLYFSLSSFYPFSGFLRRRKQ